MQSVWLLCVTETSRIPAVTVVVTFCSFSQARCGVGSDVCDPGVTRGGFLCMKKAGEFGSLQALHMLLTFLLGAVRQEVPNPKADRTRRFLSWMKKSAKLGNNVCAISRGPDRRGSPPSDLPVALMIIYLAIQFKTITGSVLRTSETLPHHEEQTAAGVTRDGLLSVKGKLCWRRWVKAAHCHTAPSVHRQGQRTTCGKTVTLTALCAVHSTRRTAPTLEGSPAPADLGVGSGRGANPRPRMGEVRGEDACTTPLESADRIPKAAGTEKAGPRRESEHSQAERVGCGDYIPTPCGAAEGTRPGQQPGSEASSSLHGRRKRRVPRARLPGSSAGTTRRSRQAEDEAPAQRSPLIKENRASDT
ncbi:hypothetical protein H920_15348 [Fukomys damarensis]|uniref:Uncharacterized protein n=1 Tax=Fukomys damarensis TaxID=885580 RepID=A0A091CY58_FUKDA|nr:hypothetical protein H920_15348 [Fukomys damarensis]